MASRGQRAAVDEALPVADGPRTQIGEIQRARIIAGVVETVAEGGYVGLTVAEVIARARISRRTFYELFSDRDDCFMAAFAEALGCAQRLVVQAYEAQSGWRERIGAGLLALLCFCDEEPALAHLLLVDALAAGPAVLERRAAVVDALASAIDRGRLESRRGARAGGVAGGARDPGSLAAEGVVGAVLGVLHGRLSRAGRSASQGSLVALAGPLMSMIVLPYLGPAASQRELVRRAPAARNVGVGGRRSPTNPLRGLNMRITYRTLRVLWTLAELPGASNRAVADRAGVSDQGQISKLLGRLQRLGLIENGDGVRASGEANAWRLTARGEEVIAGLRDRDAA